MSARLPALVHRGSVAARGFTLDPSLVGRAVARGRVLAAWSVGSTVHELDDGRWLLRWPGDRRLRVETAPGGLVVQRFDRLIALPVSEERVRATGGSSGAVIAAVAGELRASVPHVVLDPSDWLDVSGLVAVSPEPPPAGQPAVVADALDSPAFDARQQLGDHAASPSLPGFLASLRATGRLPGSAAALLGRVAGAVLSVVAWPLSFFARRRSDRPSDARAASSRSPKATRAWNRLVGLLGLAQLTQVFGWRQARYVQRMIDMFERGSLDDALRHAIPLGSGLSGLVARLRLGLPSPRSSLRFTSSSGGSDAFLIGGDNLHEILEQLYERALQALLATSRVRDAAFVLAELLNRPVEAVELLEKHGELRLAAELAEGKQCQPALIIRQWFLARDRERAVLVARRTGQFASAIVHLERTGRVEEAVVLRALWADSVALQGDYATATEIAWAEVRLRSLALGWLDRVVDLGGPAAARALVRRVTLVPSSFEQARDELERLLGTDGVEGELIRSTCADELLALDATPETRVLARTCARRLVRDVVAGARRSSPQRLTRLAVRARDGALRAELRPLGLRGGVEAERSVRHRTLEIPASDVGTLALHDGAFLPNGRALVALGETGARLLSRDAAVLAHFDQPSERLVVSATGNRAIGLARRGETWRLSRFQLDARRASRWCEARLDAFATEHDGSRWFVGVSGRGAARGSEEGLGLDVLADGLSALGVGPKDEGPVAAVAQSPTACVFYTVSRHGVVGWIYELPELLLRRRIPLSAWDGNGEEVRILAADIDGSAVLARQDGDGHVGIRLVHPLGTAASWSLRLGSVVDVQAHARGGVVAVTGACDGAAVLTLLSVGNPRPRTVAVLGGARRARPRVGADGLVTVVDDRGRFLVLDAESEEVVRDLRC